MITTRYLAGISFLITGEEKLIIPLDRAHRVLSGTQVFTPGTGVISNLSKKNLNMLLIKKYSSHHLCQVQIPMCQVEFDELYRMI